MQVKKDIIPKDEFRRSGITMDWDTITVHNTGNPDSSAEEERAWLTNPQNKRQASWHYVIKEDTIIQALPDNEVAWHASDGRGPGNMKSLSIEVCESGDHEHSMRTAAKFIAAKLKEKGKDVNSVKQHHDWSGKDCPRLIRPVWPAYIAMVQKELDALNKPVQPKTSAWKLDGLDYLEQEGVIADFDGWAARIEEPVPAWAVFNIIAKLDRKRKE